MRLVVVAAAAVLFALGLALLVPAIKRTMDKDLRENCLAKIGNLAKATILYAGENDSRYPLAFADDGDGPTWNMPTPYPAQWPVERSKAQMEAALSVWPNTTLPLSAGAKDYFCSKTPIIHLPGYDYRLARPLPAAMTYTLNGLLHIISSERIETPQSCIMYWEGMGAVTLNGFAFSNPTFKTTTVAATFDNNKQAYFLKPLGRYAVHGNKYSLVFADGHAKNSSSDALPDAASLFPSHVENKAIVEIPSALPRKANARARNMPAHSN